MKRLLLVVSIMLLAGSVNATLYSFDFSAQGYVHGQDLEGVIYGPSQITSELGDLRYFSDLWRDGIGTNGTTGSVGDIYFDFSEAVSNLSFRAGDGGGDVDAFSITLYEFGTNNLLGSWDSPLFDGGVGPMWYTMSLGIGNVGRAVFDPGNSGVLPGNLFGTSGLMISNFGFSTSAPAVPEPATMLLFGLGMAGIGIIRRKRG